MKKPALTSSRGLSRTCLSQGEGVRELGGVGSPRPAAQIFSLHPLEHDVLTMVRGGGQEEDDFLGVPGR